MFAFSLEPRLRPSSAVKWASPFVAVCCTAVFAALLLALQRVAPVEGIKALIVSPLADASGWAEVLLKAAPLTLTALGLALAFRANINNIGAEGQIIMGGIGATAVAIHVPDSLSSWLVLPGMALIGVLAGMLWAFVPALLRSRYDVSETLTTLLLTYVAAQALFWIANGPWRDPSGANLPETMLFPSAAILPKLAELGWTFWDGTRLNISVFLVVIAVPLVWFLLGKSHIGYRVAVGGMSPKAASYAGFSKSEAIWLSLMFSGGCAGLAGAIEIGGAIGQLQGGWTPGYGFVAIVACFLGRLHPISIALSSFLLALIEVGASNLQMLHQVPSAMSSLLQGALLISLLACDLFVRYRLKRSLPSSGGVSSVKVSEVAA